MNFYSNKISIIILVLNALDIYPLGCCLVVNLLNRKFCTFENIYNQCDDQIWQNFATFAKF